MNEIPKSTAGCKDIYGSLGVRFYIFTFLNCLDETHDLVSTYQSQALGIALDLYHWGHQPEFIDRLPQLAPRLALVQLGDGRAPPSAESNRCQLGDGTIPLRPMVRGLISAGYSGYFEVELMGEEIEAADYRDVLARSVKTFREWAA